MCDTLRSCHRFFFLVREKGGFVRTLRTPLGYVPAPSLQTQAQAHPDALVDNLFTSSVPFHPVLLEKINGDSAFAKPHYVQKDQLNHPGSTPKAVAPHDAWLSMVHQHLSAMLLQQQGTASALSTLIPHPAYTDCMPTHPARGDKNPGVRHIGVCETARRTIGKAISSMLHHNIQAAAAPSNCAQTNLPVAKQQCMHSWLFFSSLDTEVVVLVDASNAFNQLNRQLALRSISVLCPSLACFVVNIC